VTGPARPYRRWTGVGIAAAVACGLCCAAPLIGVLGGIGALSAVGAAFDVLRVVSIALAVLALGGAAALWLRRRRRRACQVPDRPADLGMPAPARREPR